MATRFSHNARIGAPIETVYSAYGSEEYWRERLLAVGTDKDSLDDFASTSDGVRVTITQHIPEDDIPDSARRFLPGELTIVRTSTYSGFDGRTFTGSARAEAAGGLGLISGDATAVDRDGAAEESVSGQVKVSVPLLGGKLEKMVVSHLDRLFEAEYRHLNRWTAAR